MKVFISLMRAHTRSNAAQRGEVGTGPNPVQERLAVGSPWER